VSPQAARPIAATHMMESDLIRMLRYLFVLLFAHKDRKPHAICESPDAHNGDFVQKTAKRHHGLSANG
jgi:hypothetical protein